jgi:Ig-like domain CHU_C associated/Secretion system C-terminal sorting domain
VLTGGTLLQTGPQAPFTSPSISNSTTYYVTIVSVPGCVGSSRVPVVATVNIIPTIISSTPASRCGEGTVNLLATSSNEGTINWYDAPTGGSVLGTGNFTTPSLNTATTYYAEAVANGCPSSSRTAVIATLKPIPSVTSANVSRCDAGTVTFEAVSNGTISWFSAATGGSALGTGANFTTPSLTLTTPYFIEAVLNGCISLARTSVSAIINATPAQPTVSQNNANIEAPVLASSSGTGNQWYKNNVAISGSTNPTYTIVDAGTYKVQVTSNGCSSPFSSDVAYVVTGDIQPKSTTIEIYPNPVSEELIINLSGFEYNNPVSISVMDLLGRNMHNALGSGGGEARVDVRQYHGGQYLVLLRQGQTRVSKSFIKK